MKNYDELREKVKALKQSIETGMLIPITKNTVTLLDDVIHFINTMEKKEIFEKEQFETLKGELIKTDVTKEYENMIHAFEGDFSIAFNYGDYAIFDDLRRLYENKNKRLIKDTEKLQELCFGLRYGIIKIYKIENKEK